MPETVNWNAVIKRRQAFLCATRQPPNYPALTVHQCWADALVDGHKDVENRSWKTQYRGPLLIHAGKSRKSLASSHAAYQEIMGRSPNPDPVMGAIIGVVDLVDIVRDSDSLWACRGDYHWVVANARRIEPIYCQGKLNLFYPNQPINLASTALPQRVANQPDAMCQLSLSL